MDPRAGTHVDEVVRLAHGVLVVLHHQQGVAQIPQMLHGAQQHVVVPLVKADGRLVQNIQHPHERGADLGGQTDALALPAGQGARLTAEGKVLEPHRLQKMEAGADLFQDLVGDYLLGGGKGKPLHKFQGLGHRLGGKPVDGLAPHRHRQRFRFEPLALAVGTGHLAHQLLQLPAGGVRLSLPVAALHVGDDALKGLVEYPLAVGPVIFQTKLFPFCSVEDHVHDLVRQLPHRGFQIKVIFFRQGVEIHPGDAVPPDIVPAIGGDGPVQQGLLLVGDDQVRVALELEPQAGAGGAGPEGVVEGKHAGGELLDGDPAVLAGIILGEGDVPVLPHHVYHRQPSRQGGGGLDGVSETAADVVAHHQAVHHDLDVVLLVLVQLDLLGQLIERAVYPHPDIARLAGVLQHLGVLPLLPPDDRGHHLDAGGLGQGQDLVHDLIDRLLVDLLAALGTMGRSDPRPQKAQIVVDLGHRAHGGPGIFGGGFLIDGNGGRKPLDIVHIRLLHLAHEHAGIGG